jgi:hypothetical protein
MTPFKSKELSFGISAASPIVRFISASRGKSQELYIEAESRKELVVSPLHFSEVELG